MSEHVVLTRTDGVLEIRLNRPEKKNALTRDMYDAMADAFQRRWTQIRRCVSRC